MRTLGLKVLATFTYNAGAVLPAVSLLGGWPVWKAAITAGVSAVVEILVVESKKYLASAKAGGGE